MVRDLLVAVGRLDETVVEVHAGSVYTDALCSPLQDAGAVVTEPLAGLTQGRRLAWYGSGPPRRVEVVDESMVLNQLRDAGMAVRPDDLVRAGRSGLAGAGLYSWWVDEAGAADLSRGLGIEVAPGLIYAGLAGATRAVSGRKSSNTLWGRITGMHLGRRHALSTLRLTLGSVLAEAFGSREIDERRLTDWMFAHLRVIVVPVADADALDALETEVLDNLDPPLNLAKRPTTSLRARLTVLRQAHRER